jgi:hypothetical protein
VLLAGGRLWRALEHNTRPGWASGYSACVLSAAADAPDLLDAAAWTLSGELPFAGAVAARVPPGWSRPGVASTFGWLEGGAVDPGDGGASGVRVVLRVNSLPAANKAALLSVAAPGATAGEGAAHPREAKLALLSLYTHALGLHLHTHASARPAAVVAGTEPEKTNELLQVLAVAAAAGLHRQRRHFFLAVRRLCLHARRPGRWFAWCFPTRR